MKTVGIVAEYNPFHNGHKYQIEEAKKRSGADRAVIVMSGDFTQRGAPAIMPKHLRVQEALHGGADLVIELPVFFATASAEYFAKGAVSLLEALHVDALSFGCETDDLTGLTALAQILAEEPAKYRLLLRQFLKDGCSFPKAREEALKQAFPDVYDHDLLSSPNNTLALEYLKTLVCSGSSMEVYPVKRIGAPYHGGSGSHYGFESAETLRNHFSNLCFRQKDMLYLMKYMSVSPELILQYGTRYPLSANDFSGILRYRITKESRDSLQKYFDVHASLANRIKNHENDYLDFEQYCDLLKTAELTHTRVRRALLHILLEITDGHKRSAEACRFAPYARILGFRKEAADILTMFKENSRLPLLTKLAGQDTLSPDAKRLLQLDISASNLYEILVTDKYRTPYIEEHQKRVCIL